MSAPGPANCRYYSGFQPKANLRTFARKSSNIDNFIKPLPLIANELLVPEMQK